eukprot:1284-Heterococcus_DN1.PRE.2
MVLVNALLSKCACIEDRVPLRREMVDAGILLALEDIKEQIEQSYTCTRVYCIYMMAHKDYALDEDTDIEDIDSSDGSITEQRHSHSLTIYTSTSSSDSSSCSSNSSSNTVLFVPSTTACIASVHIHAYGEHPYATQGTAGAGTARTIAAVVLSLSVLITLCASGCSITVHTSSSNCTLSTSQRSTNCCNCLCTMLQDEPERNVPIFVGMDGSLTVGLTVGHDVVPGSDVTRKAHIICQNVEVRVCTSVIKLTM